MTKTYTAIRNLQGRSLKKGMTVLAAHAYGNTHPYEILGVTGTEERYGEGGVKYDSVKAALKASGVRSLSELEMKDDENEYGHGHYLVVRDLVSGETGSWFYLFKGRWSIGSGAQPLSFRLAEKQDVVAAPVV